LVAISLGGGLICVLDLASGKIVAQAKGYAPQVAWAKEPDSGKALLVVASDKLTAFELVRRETHDSQ
jgi:hypothetical protein